MTSFAPESSLVAEVLPSPNHGERRGSAAPNLIVLHYTGMVDTAAALRRLCSPQSEVSAHYLVTEAGRIIQMVPEMRRAWHAGLGSWQGENDVNSISIGIEIANPGHEHGYPDYPRRQIAAVTLLCRGILSRHKIAPSRVVAHSDVAPARKQDPGEKFPWRLLYESGVGLWVPPAPIVEDRPFFSLGDVNPAVKDLQRRLADIGYGLKQSGTYDGETTTTVAAFQRRHRPERIDGIADQSTLATIHAVEAALRIANAPAA